MMKKTGRKEMMKKLTKSKVDQSGVEAIGDREARLAKQEDIIRSVLEAAREREKASKTFEEELKEKEASLAHQTELFQTTMKEARKRDEDRRQLAVVLDERERAIKRWWENERARVQLKEKDLQRRQEQKKTVLWI
jgi:hypothetical protein